MKTLIKHSSAALVALLLSLVVLTALFAACSDPAAKPSSGTTAAPAQSTSAPDTSVVTEGMTFGEIKDKLGYGETTNSGAFFPRTVKYTADDGKLIEVVFSYTYDDYTAFMKETGVELQNNDLLPEVFDAFTGNKTGVKTEGLTEEQLNKILNWVSADKAAKVTVTEAN